jgi:hypothetical protein
MQHKGLTIMKTTNQALQALNYEARDMGTFYLVTSPSFDDDRAYERLTASLREVLLGLGDMAQIKVNLDSEAYRCHGEVVTKLSDTVAYCRCRKGKLGFTHPNFFIVSK